MMTETEVREAQAAMSNVMLFIAEFEEWLEGEYSRACSVMASSRLQSTEIEHAENRLWLTVMGKYRACKERIEK